MHACPQGLHPEVEMVSRSTCPSRFPVRGFTLIEILIVISIIALLTSLVAPSILEGPEKARVARAKTEVTALATALDRYEFDEGILPGKVLREDENGNEFPALYGALFGRRRPEGSGGRSAPYMSLQEAQVAVHDPMTGALRRATRKEREDKTVPKYLLDPWGEPYVYRPSRGMTLIYSCGSDGVDNTAFGVDGDDIRAD